MDIFVCAKNGDVNELSLHICRHPESIESTAQDGMRPLLIAAANGHFTCCEALLQAGATVSAKDQHNLTALHYAAREGAVPVVQLLVQQWNASVDVFDVRGRTPLYLAAEEDHYECCRILIEAGANVNPQFKDPPLSGHVEALPPLHAAAFKWGSKAICELLIQSGARVNATDGDGHSALYLATECDRVECCEVLLRAGAIANGASSKESPFIVAAMQGLSAMCKLFIDFGASVNFQTNDGKTPLLMAAQEGHAECCRILIEHGHADVNIKDHQNSVALELAMTGNHIEACRVLINYGASSDPVICNETLYGAVAFAHYEVAKLLVFEAGADIPVGVRRTHLRDNLLEGGHPEFADFIYDFPMMKIRWSIASIIILQKLLSQRLLSISCCNRVLNFALFLNECPFDMEWEPPGHEAILSLTDSANFIQFMYGTL